MPPCQHLIFSIFLKCRSHDFVVYTLRSGAVQSELELLEQRVLGNYVDFLMCVKQVFHLHSPPCLCDEIPGKVSLKEEGFIFGSGFQRF